MRRIAIATAAAALAAGIGFGLPGGGAATAPVATPGASSATPAVADRHTDRFLGSWKLGSIFIRRPGGTVDYPFGRDARGVLTYHADGGMSVGVWESDRRAFETADQRKGTARENADAMASIIGYFGSFTVDTKARTVSHRVSQAFYPNWNATTQTRSYAFSAGDRRLTLKTPPIPLGGKTGTLVVVWEKAGRS